METLLYVLFVVVCAALILLVLIQQGKGAGVGFSMGGASQAMFGGSGGREFFIKVTAVLAAAFMVICIILARAAVSDAGQYRGALSNVPAAPPAPAPGVPGLPGSAPASAPGAPLQAASAAGAPAGASKPLPVMPVAAAKPVPVAPSAPAPAPAKP